MPRACGDAGLVGAGGRALAGGNAGAGRRCDLERRHQFELGDRHQLDAERRAHQQHHGHHQSVAGADHFGGRRAGLDRHHRQHGTLAGAAAHSFDVHSGLTADVSGVGIGTAGNEADTWGEFGGRIEAGLADGLALDLDINGTTGGGALGTVLHGGAGLVYRF
ncbi:MAG: hypothetical protein WB764_02840 [Xanthobacteraceae bacterium]